MTSFRAPEEVTYTGGVYARPDQSRGRLGRRERR